jgi:hypothetical protein
MSTPVCADHGGHGTAGTYQLSRAYLKPSSSSSHEGKPDEANPDDEIDITFNLGGQLVATFSKLMHDDRHAILYEAAGRETGQKNDRPRPLQA